MHQPLYKPRPHHDFSPARKLALVIACGAVLLAAPVARAQQDARPELEAAFVEAFNGKDYAAAEKAARAWVKLRPEDFIPRYNLACALSQLGKLDEAAAKLDESVELGMTSKYQLVYDSNLSPLHEHEVYKKLLADWPAQLERAIDARVERARMSFPKTYAYEKDADWRMAFASGFDPRSLDRAREQMKRITAWWQKEVLPDGTPLVVGDGIQPDPWVMVVLPARSEYAKFSSRNFGGRAKYIPGVYDNQRKELVAQDLGATLRHEFCHVLHYRDSDRRGQAHAVWIQEGLCSLMEDLEDAKDGSLTPAPSWRTNTLHRVVKSGGRPMPLAKLVAFDQKTMTREGTALPAYALARSVFLYLHQQGKLRDFYAAYVRLWKEDATGAKALEETLGKNLAAIDKDLIVWLKGLPEVPDEVRPGRVRLPLRTGGTSGDGLLVDGVDRVKRGVGIDPAGDLAPGDALLTINDNSVHDGNELARVLNTFNPGDEVEVVFRRGASVRTTKVTLTGG